MKSVRDWIRRGSTADERRDECRRRRCALDERFPLTSDSSAVATADRDRRWASVNVVVEIRFQKWLDEEFG